MHFRCRVRQAHILAVFRRVLLSEHSRDVCELIRRKIADLSTSTVYCIEVFRPMSTPPAIFNFISEAMYVICIMRLFLEKHVN